MSNSGWNSISVESYSLLDDDIGHGVFFGGPPKTSWVSLHVDENQVHDENDIFDLFLHPKESDDNDESDYHWEEYTGWYGSVFSRKVRVLAGKTSVNMKVLDKFKASNPNLNIKGFYTSDIREGSERVGFQVVTLDGRRGPLASSKNSSLSPKLNLLLDSIETQLNTRNPKLVTWFKMVKLPNLALYFIPLFKKSSEYGRSGVAEVILSICFCAAVDKLAERVSCPRFTLSIPEIMGELMDLSYSLVSMDRLHSLASKAGVEQEFLAHFGSKVLPNKESREVAFWIGLVYKRLCVAFRIESFISSREGFNNTKILAEEMEWLDFYTAVLDEYVVTFFLRSKNLLTMCLEDYLAAYYRSGERMRIAERFVNQPMVPLGNPHTINGYIFPGLRTPELMMTGIQDVWPQYVSVSSKIHPFIKKFEDKDIDLEILVGGLESPVNFPR
ncbi:hypothetical protein GIB67_036209 [Kingdonia uniflora]|uniref:Uncharacterized protein n=1 Tax=Kingdonia uniflora TaxID=39325 RepID=A0A7J7L4S7_9MAGN|nr:hypothetical protein GIB67_036209 [Kingdonia uniflora]